MGTRFLLVSTRYNVCYIMRGGRVFRPLLYYSTFGKPVLPILFTMLCVIHYNGMVI